MVQWIARKPPKLKMWVRLPPRALESVLARSDEVNRMIQLENDHRDVSCGHFYVINKTVSHCQIDGDNGFMYIVAVFSFHFQ